MRVRVLRRVTLGATVVLMVFGLFGCKDGSAPGLTDAREFQTRMDAKAQEVLPALRAELGGTYQGMSASFHSKMGKLGVWNYQATGSLVDIPLTQDEAVAGVTEVLEAAGMTTSVKQEVVVSVVGRVDGIVTSVQVPEAVAGTTIANVSMSSEEGLSSEGDFAEDAPTVDYLTFLE